MIPPTFHPNDDWLKIQIRSAAMWLDGIGVKPTCLIHDGDKKFGKMFKAFWKSEGVRCLKIPPRSPKAIFFAESYIGAYKHQCLTGCALLRSSVPSELAIRLAHRLLSQAGVFCLSLDQLDYINRKWVTYYNNERPHQGKDIGNNILRLELCPASQWHPYGTSHSTRFPFASQAVSTPVSEGKIVRHESLGGVLAWYERAAA